MTPEAFLLICMAAYGVLFAATKAAGKRRGWKPDVVAWAAPAWAVPIAAVVLLIAL